MTDFLASSRVVDVVLVVLAIEVVVLATAKRHNGAAARDRLLTAILAALPGAFLLLALRAALSGAGGLWIAVWLAAAFPAHLADLRRRAR